jgi:hypothetical protein
MGRSHRRGHRLQLLPLPQTLQVGKEVSEEMCVCEEGVGVGNGTWISFVTTPHHEFNVSGGLFFNIK